GSHDHTQRRGPSGSPRTNKSMSYFSRSHFTQARMDTQTRKNQASGNRCATASTTSAACSGNMNTSSTVPTGRATYSSPHKPTHAASQPAGSNPMRTRATPVHSVTKASIQMSARPSHDGAVQRVRRPERQFPAEQDRQRPRRLLPRPQRQPGAGDKP